MSVARLRRPWQRARRRGTPSLPIRVAMCNRAFALFGDSRCQEHPETMEALRPLCIRISSREPWCACRTSASGSATSARISARRGMRRLTLTQKHPPRPKPERALKSLAADLLALMSFRASVPPRTPSAGLAPRTNHYEPRANENGTARRNGRDGEGALVLPLNLHGTHVHHLLFGCK